MAKYDLEFFEQKMRGVESLDLNGLLIGDAGVACLAEVLKKNKTVSWLDLQYNRIGPEVRSSVTAVQQRCSHANIYTEYNIVLQTGCQAAGKGAGMQQHHH
jgi:hypothetical protein